MRRSVADARERAAYDKLVGAGTYVFGLGPDACVDATRAGAGSCCSVHAKLGDRACCSLRSVC